MIAIKRKLWFWCLVTVTLLMLALPAQAGVSPGPLDDWEWRSSPTDNYLHNVIFAQDLFVAVGEGGAIVSSTNGVNWTDRSCGVDYLFKGICNGIGTFVAIGSDGGILTSEDGATWVGRESGVSDGLDGVAYGNGAFVASGASGTVVTSADGITWTEPDTQGLGSEYLQDIIYADGTFVTVGENGSIYTSPNGVSWAKRPTSTSFTIASVSYGGGTFVAVGSLGSVLTSTDGATWISRTSGTTNNLFGVAYGGGTFVSVGNGGTILTSTDGITWTEKDIGTGLGFRDTAFDGSTFVVVGDEGVILQSVPAAAGPALTIGTSSLPSGAVGASYSTTLSASGGTAPYSWNAVGLPQGLEINSSTGVITGTPVTAKLSAISVTVNDSAGASASKNLSLTVNAAAASSDELTITTTSLPTGTLETPYSAAVSASGGDAPYTWSASNLHPGLDMDASSGVISGTPTDGGIKIINVTVHGSGGDSATKYFFLTIRRTASVPSGPALAIGTAGPSTGITGEAYTYTFTASGGSSPYAFLVTDGCLPEGLTLAQDGTLSGTPTEAGTFSYTVSVCDGNGSTSSHTYTHTINQVTAAPAPSGENVILLTIGSLQATVNGQPYTLDAAPVVDAPTNRTLVPIRFISEALGAQVTWVAETQRVVIQDSGKLIVLGLGSTNVRVDSQIVSIDCPPVSLPPGRTYVPLRFVAEALGATVSYNGANKQITITR